MEAQAAWKAEEAKRLAAAEAKWREEAGKAVAAAKASMPQGESEDVRRLRADHARLQTAIAERDAMLAQVRAETEQIKARAQQELTRTQQERDTVIAGSRDEIQRLRDMQSALQTSLAERDAALARAQSAPQTSGADAAEMQRLRDAQATLQSSLTELDATLAQTRAEAEESANRAADDMRSMREAYAMIQAKLSERTAELAKFQSAGAPQAAETVPAPDTRELDRLREANADLRATLTQRDNAMTRLQEQLDQAKTAAPPPASPVDTRELDRLQETNADLRANLAQRDVAMAQLREQLDQAKTGPRPDDVALRDANAALAELRARCERAEAALAEARTQAVLAPPIAAPLASPLDSDTQALRDELATLRSTLSDRESQLSTLRASQADEHQRWEQDAQATLTRAQLAWEADVAKRIADAEIEWQKNAGGALTEAQTRYKTAEANLAALRLRGDSMRDRTDSADLSRLRGDLAALQTTLGDREAQLVFARSVFESHGIKWPDANEMRSAGKSNFGPKRQERMEFVRGSAGMIAAAAFVGALVVFGFFLFPRLIGALPQDWQDDISVATEQMQNYIGDANRKIGVTAAETPAAAVVQALATVTRSANVRSAPSSASTVLVTLPRGTSVSTGIRSGNWVKVSIDGKTEGWIFAQYLKDSAPNAAIRK
jgi:chromosome segregation ATPase